MDRKTIACAGAALVAACLPAWADDQGGSPTVPATDTTWRDLMGELPHDCATVVKQIGLLTATDVTAVVLAATPSDDSVTPGCRPRADMNNDRDITVEDLLEFLTAYFSGAKIADRDGSQSLNEMDIYKYLDNYFSGECL